MAVDFSKKAHVIVVHGVQGGTDKEVIGVPQIKKLIEKSLAQSHITRDFDVIGYFYEDINDQAQEFYQKIGGALLKGKPLAGVALKYVIDYAGDVVTSAAQTSTAGKILNGLTKKILESYEAGHQVVVVSHSLGTVYSLDAVNALIAHPGAFNGDDRDSWPVQGLITMGSPLGLDIDLQAIRVFDKRPIRVIQKSKFEVFPWFNFYNRLDPIVSGNLFGRPVEIKGSKGPVENRYGLDMNNARWMLQGRSVTSGDQWVAAHSCYWKNAKIGDQIIQMLWG